MSESDSGVAAVADAAAVAGAGAGAAVDAGGWVFGGIARDNQLSDWSLADQAVLTPLKDLWHWNGDLDKPAWTEKKAMSSLWPPAWQAPQGWASDSDGGELWLVGDSGQVHELLYTAEAFAKQVHTRRCICEFQCFCALFVRVSA